VEKGPLRLFAHVLEALENNPVLAKVLEGWKNDPCLAYVLEGWENAPLGLVAKENDPFLANLLEGWENNPMWMPAQGEVASRCQLGNRDEGNEPWVDVDQVVGTCQQGCPHVPWRHPVGVLVILGRAWCDAEALPKESL
jgi:hypothetical protein